MTRDDTDTVLSQEDGTRDGRPNLAPGIRTHLGEHLRTVYERIGEETLTAVIEVPPPDPPSHGGPHRMGEGRGEDAIVVADGMVARRAKSQSAAAAQWATSLALD